MGVKSSIKVYLENNRFVYRLSRYIYTAIFHAERLPGVSSYGTKNADKEIFVIRPNSEDGIQGLMSLFIQTIRWIDYARTKGYTPFVDFKQYKTQYYDGIHNVWEYYFTQPSELTLEEVYESKKVIRSGPMLFDDVDYRLFGKDIFYKPELCLKCSRAIWDNIKLSKEAQQIVEQEAKELDIENCIGIYIRGTDYVQMKPTGENIQPTIEEFIKKVDYFAEKYSNSKLFLVTEDYNNYTALKEHFESRLQIVSFDDFIKNYDGRDFLSKSNTLNANKKKRGMDYLAKIVLLSKCRYLVASITMGSITAYAMNGKKYTDEYIFDLGLYP